MQNKAWKYSLVSVILGLAIFFWPAAPAQGIDTAKHQARSYVVKMLDKNPAISANCSAVIVAPGVAVTAKHCTGFITPQLESNDGKRLDITKQTPHPDEDSMILDVPGLHCPCAPVAELKAETDENAFAVGFPYGLLEVLTVGHIQGRVKGEDSKYYLVATTPVAPGNSGGGLFVIREGAVYLVGIVSMTDPMGGLTLAAEVTGANSFLPKTNSKE